MWDDIYIIGANIIFFSYQTLTDMHRLRLIDSKIKTLKKTEGKN
jgi:hypothetical protein